MAFKNPDNGTYFNNDVHLRSIGKKELTKDDISILQQLEKQNKVDYEDTYISEFLKCRNNIFYFIHNYCNIGEVGNPLLYEPSMMNRKYRRVIKGLNRYHKAILMASRQLGIIRFTYQNKDKIFWILAKIKIEQLIFLYKN